MENVDLVKCSCSNCVCIVPVAKGIKDSAGKIYCSTECSSGHPNKKGCDCNTGCACG